MSARETALQALIACRKNGAWSNGALKQLIARDRLDARDAALATRLCYGVVQNRGKLDFYLRQLLTGKIRSLHPVVRDILHLGLYQLHEMDKIPESAAVNESVELAKKYCKGQKNAPALVNAVLRNAASTLDSWQEPVSYADRYSHPDELITLLKQSLPKGMLEPMLIADNMAPPVTIQVNTLKTTAAALTEALEAQGIDCQPHAWMKDCLVLSGLGNLERLAEFGAGHFYVQDPASKLSVRCAGLEKGWKVLDCCAAPGGKSLLLIEEMQDEGRLVSCDVSENRVQLIRKAVERMGFAHVEPRVSDGTKPDAGLPMADAILVDAPCSGLGILAKKPDIRYKTLEKARHDELLATQSAILDTAAAHLKEGGRLVYSTCTIDPADRKSVV